MTSRSIALCLAVASIAATFASPAGAREQTYKTTHFTLTWDDAGRESPDAADGDSDGVPDSVQRMGAAFENARGFLIDELGYLDPPTHGRYELYVGTTDRGFTRPVPGGQGRSRPSLTMVPPRLMRRTTTTRAIDSFAVHEYFHAIQIGYDVGDASWVKEATAAWVEGVYPRSAGGNQNYLQWFVPVPNLALDNANGSHEYGAFLFFQFLTERYSDAPDPGIVREMWEDMAVPQAIPGAPDRDVWGALEEVLAARGTTIFEAWREFLLWQWQLKRFANGADYKRALREFKWPTAPTSEVTGESCRIDASLPRFSGLYERFIPGPSRTALLTVSGSPETAGFVILKLVKRPPLVTDLTFDADGMATFEFATRQVRHVTIGVGPGTKAGGQTPISYSLQLDAADNVSATAPEAPTSLTHGDETEIFGRIDCNGAPAPFARVMLTETEVASGTTRTTELFTDDLGTWALTVEPTVHTTYSVAVVDPFFSSATSPEMTIEVEVDVTIAISDDLIESGGSIVVEGTVTPAHEKPILIEVRRAEGVWHTAAEATVDASGDYAAEITFPADGAWEVRARMPGTGHTDHLPGESAARLLQVGGT